MSEIGDKLIIFDADGVFMDEMPYWRTALAAAVVRHELAPRDQAGWDALGDACLVRRRVQRITKGRGCNSNWDLAAVMIRALDAPSVHADVAVALADGDYLDAAKCLAAAMEALWNGPPEDGHRLSGFGIDREGFAFAEAVKVFQVILRDEAAVGWRFPRQALAHSVADTQALFDHLRGLGAELGVCTSRHSEETLEPMRRFEILDRIAPQRIVTQTVVEQGQEATGAAPLGKPHWFPVACAVVGSETARAMVLDGRQKREAATGRWVYVGDAPADFEAVTAARERGLIVDYVHIDTDLTDAETTERIRTGAATRAVKPDLLATADVLAELLR